MKKMLLLLVSMLLLFSLCACSKPKEPYTVKEGWRTFEIDPEACTISFKTDIYRYDISGNCLEYEITITYPDGSVYREGRKETFPVDFRLKERSNDFGNGYYVSGDILCKVLETELPAPPDLEKLGSENVLSISQTGRGVMCAIEPFYEDEYGMYFFPQSYDSYHITVTYVDGTTENIIPAFDAGRVTLIDLQKFGIQYGIDPISDYWPLSDKD